MASQMATGLDNVSNTPVTAVVTFGLFLAAVHSFIGVSVVVWDWIQPEALSAADVGITFVATVVWLPLKNKVLPWLSKPANG